MREPRALTCRGGPLDGHVYTKYVGGYWINFIDRRWKGFELTVLQHRYAVRGASVADLRLVYEATETREVFP